jgi:hypothetical protein
VSITIIGFGKIISKDLGEIGLEQICIWCSAHVCYHLVILRTWFTYFFIPVIPYRKEYRIVCPICSGNIRILGEEVEAARRGELTLSRR